MELSALVDQLDVQCEMERRSIDRRFDDIISQVYAWEPAPCPPREEYP